MISDLGCLPLAPRKLGGEPGRKASIVIAAFVAAIALSIADIAPLPISFSAAAAIVVVTNIVPLREVYDAIDWPVVVLLGAMMPIGGALETTGVTHLITNGIVALSGSLGPVAIMTIILIITMTLSDIMNNAANPPSSRHPSPMGRRCNSGSTPMRF